MGSEHGSMPDDPQVGGTDAAERQRVIDAATAIFTGYGPASVTLKWIALASGIPVERLSTEWPTVDALLASVLDNVASAVEAVGWADFRLAPEELAERGRLIEIYERVVARSLLDGVNPAQLETAFPQTDRLVATYQSALDLDERTARYRVYQGCALEWGWRLFGPHLLIACGLDGEPEGRPYDELQKLHEQLIQLPPVTPL